MYLESVQLFLVKTWLYSDGFSLSNNNHAQQAQQVGCLGRECHRAYLRDMLSNRATILVHLCKPCSPSLSHPLVTRLFKLPCGNGAS